MVFEYSKFVTNTTTPRFEPCLISLDQDQPRREPETDYVEREAFEVAVVDTGENGVFTRG